MSKTKPQHLDRIKVGQLDFVLGTTWRDKGCWVTRTGDIEWVLIYRPKRHGQCDRGCCEREENPRPAHWEAQAIVEWKRIKSKRRPHKTPEGKTIYPPDSVRTERFSESGPTPKAAVASLQGRLEMLCDVLAVSLDRP